MRKLLASLIFILVISLGAKAQTGFISDTFRATGAGRSVNLTTSGISYHMITWNKTGTVSGCTVGVDSSADGVTWNSQDVIAIQTCTSNGFSGVVNVTANFIRIHMVTFTGSGSVSVTWDGFTTAPGGVLTSSGAPITTCLSNQLDVDTTTGSLYTCNAGTWRIISSGGTPGGSSGQTQVNNGGVFGGVANPTTPSGNPALYTSTPVGGVAQTPAFSLPGTAGSTISGATYAVQCDDTTTQTDRNQWLYFTHVGAIAATIAQAGTGCFTNNFTWYMQVAQGAGPLTLTATTSVVYVNGATTGSTMTINGGQMAVCSSRDNTDYYCNVTVDDSIDPTTVKFDEEFPCGSVTSSQIGTYGWALTNIGAAPTESCVTGPQAAGDAAIGVARLATTTTSGQGGVLSLQGDNQISTLGIVSALYNFDSQFRFQLQQTANTQFRIGYIPNGVSAALPYAGFYVRYDTTLQDITAATYTSGASVTGSSTQTCHAAFVGGTATATIALTGTNTIAGGTSFTAVVTGAGYNATYPPTQATLTSGTATCSGTATIAATLGAAGTGADTHWMFVSTSPNSSPETAYDTGVAPSAASGAYVRARIRNINTSTQEIGFTLYDKAGAVTVPEVTFCTSGCTITITNGTNVMVPSLDIVTATTSAAAVYWDFWKFRAYGLAR